MNMLYNTYLVEKVYDIKEDVNMIYNNYFKEILDILTGDDINKKMHLFSQLKNFNYKISSFSSNLLNSPDCKLANKKNNVNIDIGLFSTGSFYNPKDQKIQISLNMNAISMLPDIDWDIDNYTGINSDIFKYEFSSHNIKSTIAHELSHWVRDSLTDNVKHHLDKLEKNKNNIKNNNLIVNDVEIDAIVHALQQLKYDLPNYKELTWKQLQLYKPNINIFLNNLKSFPEEIKNKYKKQIYSRLYKENLLTNNLKHNLI